MRNYTDEEIKDAVKNSRILKDVLIKLNLRSAGGNYKTIKNHIKRLDLNIDHFIIKKFNGKNLTLKQILVKNSGYSRCHLKKRLMKEKLLKYECDNCKIKDWDDKPLSLQLDHINGIWNDNRIENLRFLCPNCHSQTKTFAGKNIKFIDPRFNKFDKNDNNILNNKCSVCKNSISNRAKRCIKCHNKTRHKIEWPKIEKLTEMVKSSSFLAVGKQLGVSDNAIRKHFKSNNIDWKRIKE